MFDWLRIHIESRRQTNAMNSSLSVLGLEMTTLLRTGPYLCGSPLVVLFFSELRAAQAAADRGDLARAAYLREEARKSKARVARLMQRRIARRAQRMHPR